MLNNNGPKIDLCGPTKKISNHELKNCFLSNNDFLACMVDSLFVIFWYINVAIRKIQSFFQ